MKKKLVDKFGNNIMQSYNLLGKIQMKAAFKQNTGQFIKSTLWCGNLFQSNFLVELQDSQEKFTLVITVIAYNGGEGWKGS